MVQVTFSQLTPKLTYLSGTVTYSVHMLPHLLSIRKYRLPKELVIHNVLTAMGLRSKWTLKSSNERTLGLVTPLPQVFSEQRVNEGSEGS